MGRPGRVGVLLVACLVLAAVGYVSVPPHLDDGTGQSPAQCSFYFLANDIGFDDATGPVTVTPYDQLDPERRALFDRWLEGDSRTLSIDASEWRALYNGSRSHGYVEYDGRYYRTSVSYNRCQLWEALAASR